MKQTRFLNRNMVLRVFAILLIAIASSVTAAVFVMSKVENVFTYYLIFCYFYFCLTSLYTYRCARKLEPDDKYKENPMLILFGIEAVLICSIVILHLLNKISWESAMIPVIAIVPGLIFFREWYEFRYPGDKQI